MAHESFEDNEVAELLNRYYVSIKVDREERPDIDSVYMSVCQAFTGSGGWPLTIIMTPEQKPFFAGTYLPKNNRRGMMGMTELLTAVMEKWIDDKTSLLKSGDDILKALKSQVHDIQPSPDSELINGAINALKKSFDKTHGGFGSAPKFPVPHNILFLLDNYYFTGDAECLHMAEKTLQQMYAGGIFDHVGYGFSRYSTDKYWLVPHFEKMLYDNALLTLAYLTAYETTGNDFYSSAAVKILEYILRELTDPDGAFFCAQDADSEGVEGKYYVFTPDEIIKLLGNENGEHFNKYFDITKQGNFEGKNIPNLLKNPEPVQNMEHLAKQVYKYRKNRYELRKDDKILTSWNALMIAAFVKTYRVAKNNSYLEIAQKADLFISKHLSDGDMLFTSYRDGKRSEHGFLDDYAFYIYAQISLYEATLDTGYIKKAVALAEKLGREFYDHENGGFYIYGKNGEQLIMRAKETYDGAIPSGNSVMAYNLFRLAGISKRDDIQGMARKQQSFMSSAASGYPSGYTFFLNTLQMSEYGYADIVCVIKNREDIPQFISKLPRNAIITVMEEETADHRFINGKTTFYICANGVCYPPVNDLISITLRPEPSSNRRQPLP